MNCKTCGNKLDSFEQMNAKAALQGQCVNCFTSPKEEYRRQTVNDMSMSPFTSVQKIHEHLKGVHGLSDHAIESGMSKVTHGQNMFASTANHAWRSFHSIHHEMGGSGTYHDPAATHHDDNDPMNVFHDRRAG
jgi:hypothetical protein